MSAGAAGEVRIRGAWIAEAPPAAPVHAAYLVMQNGGGEAVTLTAVTSPGFGRIEIHRSVGEAGVTRMARVGPLVLAPEETVAFGPGGLHLMLYNATRPPLAGDEIPLTFAFSNGDRIEVAAEVRKRTIPGHEHAQDPPTYFSLAMLQGLTVFVQHLLPQHFLSSLMYRLTRAEWAPFKDLFIRAFIRIYDVDMTDAVKTPPREFRSFNEFFTRALKPGARPVDPREDALVSPVDGYVSRNGIITAGRIIQAKDMDYSVNALLGGDGELASRFTEGSYATLYLSPRDYHRIHIPVAGTLERMTYVPGKLYSVNPATTSSLEGLFALNERVVTVFDTPAGKMALVMVGAIFVGSMETVWAGEITPAADRSIKTVNYPEGEHRYAKGEEIGRFNMGSTVILLFEPDRVHWEEALEPDRPVRLGEKIGTIR